MPSTVPPTSHPERMSPDEIARLATGAIGGPVGRLAAPQPAPVARAVTAAVLSLGACLTVLLGLLQKSFCVRNGWGTPDVYWKACYSDLPTMAINEALSSGDPYRGAAPLTDPALTGVLLRVLAALVPASGLERQQWFFVAWTITAAVLTIVTVVATVWTCRRRPGWAAHVAFSPLLVTVALVSTDLFGITLAALAVWAWSRQRPVTSGFLFGLAIAARTYPLLLVIVLGALALRSGTLREWARTAGVALITAVLTLGVIATVFGSGVFATYQVWANASAQLGSPWYLATMWDRPIHMSVLTVLTVLGWLIAICAGFALSLSAPVRPRFGEVAIVVLAIVLMTGKALPVQSSLWLVPLVALAGLKWRDHLLWATTEVLSFVAVWLYLGGLSQVNAALPKEWYAGFLVLRLLGLAWLAFAAARQAMRRQKVGAPGVAGHPLAGHLLPGHDVPDHVVAGHDQSEQADHDDVAGPMQGRADAVVIRYER